MSPDVLTKIFDPYFSTKQSGNELGLATVYSIVEKHKGVINAQSQPGIGSTFCILPLADNQTDNAPQVLKSPLSSVESMEGLNILIIEDDKIVQEVLTSALKVSGYTADVACEGKIGGVAMSPFIYCLLARYLRYAKKIILGISTICLWLFFSYASISNQNPSKSTDSAMYQKALKSNHPYQLVISDLTIPGGMGGREAVQKILEIDSNAKVIATSGYAMDPIMSYFEEYGFKGRIAKPFKLKDVCREITRVYNCS